MKKIILFLLIFTKNSYADFFNITAMGFFNTKSVFRGAEFWPYPSMIVAPGFLFFDRHLKVFGPNISYDFFPKRESSFRLELGLRYINDDEPPFFQFKNHEEDYRNQRKDAIDSSINFAYRFGEKKRYQLGMVLAKEVMRFKGVYSEFNASAPILPLTSLRGRFSIADDRYNKYLYGPESNSGTGFAAIGITIVIPFVPWDGIIINNFEQSWVTQTQNRNANYVRGDGDHFQFSTRWIWNAF